jgi:hypothetical protein
VSLRGEARIRCATKQTKSTKGGGTLAFVPGLYPTTDEPVHRLTVAGTKSGDARAAWLLVRCRDATCEPVRVFDPNLQRHPARVSTRTVELAPEDACQLCAGNTRLELPFASLTAAFGSHRAWRPVSQL